MNNIWYKALIQKGVGLGEKIGFPTINLNPIPKEIQHGVYTCAVDINRHIYKGIMHIGPKSIGTNNKNEIFCEIHLFDFDKIIKNKEIKFKVLKKIRDMREFKSTDELKLQIKQDIQNAKLS